MIDASGPQGAPTGPACCEAEAWPEGAWPEDLAQQAAWHKALGEVQRLKLLHLIRARELCVCDLVVRMGMPQGTLSHHLGLLVKAGLASVRKEGRWNHHQATPLALDLLGWNSKPEV